MPAPVVGDTVNWMQRPLSAGEVTNILKAFVRSDDPCLSSHSLKATTLSWAAKAEVPREQRRIWGRHSSAVQCSDSFYDVTVPTDVKTEASWSVLNSGHAQDVIELSSSSGEDGMRGTSN